MASSTPNWEIIWWHLHWSSSNCIYCIKQPHLKYNSGKLSTRLYSLDALRGFDMFWIIGTDQLVHKLAEVSGSTFWQGFRHQLEHPYWNGFTLYDLIFPLFMFLSGVSTPYSIGRELENGKSRSRMLRRVVIRGVILILLGMVYNNGLQLRPIEEFRFPSVLGKIGAAYIFANIIYLFANKRYWIWWYGGLLIGYWLLLKFTAAPGFDTRDLSEKGNFMSWFDRTVLPGRLARGIHDTVGLLNIITGTCTTLAGIIAGNYLKYNGDRQTKKVVVFAVTGAILIGVAFLWNIDFPINKNLWSSSFVLLTSGLSLLLFSLFYYTIDVAGYKSWTLFFRVIGMNSILIYMSPKFIDWMYTSNSVFAWLGQIVGEPYDIVVVLAGVILIEWLFLYLLYRNKLFLKI